LNFLTKTASTEPAEIMLTRDEILYIAKKLANDRRWCVKLALAVIECRLDADRRYQEADLAYSLLNEEITKGL
jgi:HD superfamily phosphohydrolase YqeK